ncbi:hypothetical protein J6590_035171 [Homalodisca vitripennis]|nr:hypothetical protein J6590_035171 [Homalodisca vitripennis]
METANLYLDNKPDVQFYPFTVRAILREPQKGKQGTKGQKQIVEENAETLKFYWRMALIANAVYYSLALTVLSDCFTWINILMLVISTIVYATSYQFMGYISVPKYTATGQLIDAGVDLNMEGGLSEYVLF